MNESIGDRIKRRREKAGLKQTELAEKLHVTNKTVCQWEKTSNIPLDKIVLLADFFQISLDWLVKGTGTENLKLHNTTGLSEETIEVLKDSPPIADAINELLKEPAIGFIILDQINAILKEKYVDLYYSNGKRAITEERANSIVTLIRMLELHGRVKDEKNSQ